MENNHSFTAVLFKSGSWYFVSLGADFVIEAVCVFGRTPIIATLHNTTWNTSLWTGKNGETLLAVPKKIRGALQEGDEIEVSFCYDYDRFG